MRFITLTTDFGEKDYYVAEAKGVLYSNVSDATIVDVSHNIESYNIADASFVVKQMFFSFPKNSIHLISVDADIKSSVNFLLMKYKEHFFLSADNGILSLILEEDTPDVMIRLQVDEQMQSPIQLYANVINKLNEVGYEELGDFVSLEDCVQLKELKPKIESENLVKGAIVYEDHYGNAITNITQEFFEKVRRGRDFEVSFSRYRFTRIHKFYSDFSDVDNMDGNEGRMLILFNTKGYLQVSVFKGKKEHGGSIKELTGLTYRDSITITFK